MTILRMPQILKKPNKQHQVAVTLTMMFLKKAWTLPAIEVFFFDCLKNLESKVNEISENTNKENQIKSENQLTDLTEAVNFLSENFHEFETDRKLKEEIIKSFRDQVLVLHIDFKKMEAQVYQQTQYSRRNCVLFHEIKEEKGEGTDSIIINTVN